MSIRVHNLTSRKFNFDVWVELNTEGKVMRICVYKHINVIITPSVKPRFETHIPKYRRKNVSSTANWLVKHNRRVIKEFDSINDTSAEQPCPYVSDARKHVSDYVRYVGNSPVLIASATPIIRSVEEWGEVLDVINNFLPPMSVFGVRHAKQTAKRVRSIPNYL